MSAHHDSYIPTAAYLVAPAYLQQIARMAGFKSGRLMLREHHKDEQDKTQTIFDIIGYASPKSEYDWGTFSSHTIGTLHFRQLPGNCGTVVMYYCRVLVSKNQEKIAALMLKMREHIARMAGYSLMLATCTIDSPDLDLLKAGGWEGLRVFTNSKTDRECALLYKPIIRQPRKVTAPLKQFGADN